MHHRGYRSNWARPSRNHYAPRQSATVEPRPIPAALGPEIRRISCRDISTELRNGMAEITDCHDLASFNLMDGLSKNILVPGRPPLWTPAATKLKLSADDGQYYRDDNAARFPDFPLEPVVRSIFHMNPDFDTSTIDVVGCGSTLGDLLRFVRGKADSFSFVVDTVGCTPFFVRRSLSPTEVINGVHGFGHRFVELNTTWSQDVKGSSSHQRVVTYQLGGKTILIRFEADGYIMDQNEDFDKDEDVGGVPIDVTSIQDDFLNLFNAPERAATADKETLQEKGSRISQSAVIDIKTRSARKQRNEVMAEQLPRLWIRQIDNIVLSFHDNGVFPPPAVEDIRAEVVDWENDNQSEIARLVNLIDLIKQTASDVRSGKLEVRCCEATLQFHELAPTEQTKWSAVPDKLRTQWAQAAL